MKFMRSLIKKKVNLDRIELLYASIYFLAGKILNAIAGKEVTLLVMCSLMIVFTILLIVFFRQHIYGQDKPLLTALSIYYKSMAYVCVVFTIFNFPGRIMFLGITVLSIIIYGVFSYFIYKKENYPILNPWLYLVFIGFF